MASAGKIFGIIIGIVVFLMMLFSTFAEQTVNSIEYPIGFVEPTKERVEYGKIIEFNPPDGVSKIISAMVTIQGDFDGDNQVYATINRRPCDPPIWKVARTATESVGYKMTFDCTNILSLEKSGSQDIAFSTDLPAKNVNVYYKITYYNEPSVTLEDINNKIDNLSIGNISIDQKIMENMNKIFSLPSVAVHGTEYQFGDNGKIFIQLITADKTSTINNATCVLTAYNPDNTVFFSNVTMTNLGSEGIYYYNTPTLANLGVYMVSVWCAIPQMVTNITTTLSYSDSFTSITECGGSGFNSVWNFVGNLIYDSLRDESGINHAPPDNFISVAGAFTTSYQQGTSILIKNPPNGSFNKIELNLNAITGSPETKNFVYNISICNTTVGNLTANATFGADCTSTPLLLSTNNLSCSLGSQILGFLLPTYSNKFSLSSNQDYIINLQFVSGNVSSGTNNFWTVKSKGPPAPPSDQYYRRVFNTSAVFTFASSADYILLDTPANLIISSVCYSGGKCLLLNGTSGYAERMFDASSATSLNLSIWTRVGHLVIGDKASIKFWDGTWKTLFEWIRGQEHNWTQYNITLEAMDYNFRPDNMIGLFLEQANSNADITYYVDDINIYKTGTTYFFQNGTEYQIGRGSTEVHVSLNASGITNAINVSVNNTAIAENIWNYATRTLTDYNQSSIIGLLLDINGTLHYLNSSEYQHYNTIYSTLLGMEASLNQINTTINTINSSIANLNVSVNLTPIENLITSVNSSVMQKLYMLQNDLQDINDSITGVYGLVNSVNSSIAGQLYGISTQISNIDSLIIGVNASIMQKLYGIQDEIYSVNQTVISANQSIQIEIQNLINTLAIQLANLTNLTLNLSVNSEQIAQSTWSLFFQRGTPPLSPSTEYYCDVNNTNVLHKLINYTFTENGITTYHVKNEEELCPYGCDYANNACNLHPALRILIVIAVSIVIILIVFILIRRFRT